ncbi:hypothetical protein ASPCADRAFT_129683 [Aspergillus carbonarius ITEM 5010]|uniref:Uncharacterized protein n=1 Tax=Aspergillus carbonarius (strain ITEM 5010) TaxID=602072 RepID=A0A1R3RQ39_ASPC5|nr:hypothetical protein ASPCADRAFT_129683 [Aspergillus carbonarius ITEM 5010]
MGFGNRLFHHVWDILSRQPVGGLFPRLQRGSSSYPSRSTKSSGTNSGSTKPSGSRGSNTRRGRARGIVHWNLPLKLLFHLPLLPDCRLTSGCLRVPVAFRDRLLHHIWDIPNGHAGCLFLQSQWNSGSDCRCRRARGVIDWNLLSKFVFHLPLLLDRCLAGGCLRVLVGFGKRLSYHIRDICSR